MASSKPVGSNQVSDHLTVEADDTWPCLPGGDVLSQAIHSGGSDGGKPDRNLALGLSESGQMLMRTGIGPGIER